MAFSSHFLIISALLTCACAADELRCQNGGTFNGNNCTCLIGFSGRICQYIETFKSDTFSRSVKVSFVINEAFDEKYDNEASLEYKEFVEDLTQRMNMYYKDSITHFQEVLITSVSRGGPLGRLSENPVGQMRPSDEAMATDGVRPRADSVSVKHDVVLAISNNADFGSLYDDNFQALNVAVEKLVGCTDCPFTVTAQPVVEETVFDLGSVCNKLVKDPIVAYYYETVSIDGVHTCVTVCSSHHPTPKGCHSKGLCRVRKDTGPLCECQSVNSNWYLGDDCSFPIHRTSFYVGLSLTLGCLLVTLVSLMAYVLISKHKQKQRTGDDKDKLEQWQCGDFEWSRYDSSTDITNAGNRNSNLFFNSGLATGTSSPTCRGSQFRTTWDV